MSKTPRSTQVKNPSQKSEIKLSAFSTKKKSEVSISTPKEVSITFAGNDPNVTYYVPDTFIGIICFSILSVNSISSTIIFHCVKPSVLNKYYWLCLHRLGL